MERSVTTVGLPCGRRQRTVWSTGYDSAVAVLLALLSAVLYGTGDFLGGVASRRAGAFAVTVVSQCVGLVGLLVGLAFLHGRGPSGAGLVWGAAGGLCGAVALVLFYGALAAGAMSVVAPLTAVVSAVVPVGVGLATGERPSGPSLLGVALAVPAIALIARQPEHPDRRVEPHVLGAALAAGVGFGLFFVFLGTASDHSGLWPVVAARAASVTLLVAIAVGARRSARLPEPVRPAVVATGLFDSAANAVYLAAASRGLLSLVAVAAALYPASTVVLARLVLAERIGRTQAAGFALAVAAVSLVAAGS
jgi:drug/metabolite transporter (DMT)-like permease